MVSSDELKDLLVKQSRAAGFEIVRITSPGSISEAGIKLMAFLADGRHGDMDWLKKGSERRADPVVLWPQARSVIMLGLNYGPDGDPLRVLMEKSRGAISVYAHGKDYHDIIKKKLKQIAGWLHRVSGAEVKVFVDTAPVMEKPLAQAAGVGWQGKHTNLVSTQFGSWLFLGSIFTTLALTTDESESDHCGSCRACLDICPTNAFPAPYQLDARRCISYLTIEYKGHIPLEFRAPIGNRIFGCDDCLAVCPWNKYATLTQEVRLHPRVSADNPPLADLLDLDDEAFRTRFRGSAIKRTGRDRFIRNVLIASGNSGHRTLLSKIVVHLEDKSPIVRAMAVWACSRLCAIDEFKDLRRQYLPLEADQDVIVEWQRYFH